MWMALGIQIELDESGARLIGASRFVFPVNSVQSVGRSSRIPLIGRAIRIRHNIIGYPVSIIFLTFKNPAKVLAGIAATGFPIK